MPSPLDQPELPTPRRSPAKEDTTYPSTTPAPLAITDKPANPQAEDGKEEEEEVHVLDVGEGNVVKLDKLGPMIINSDGTLSRIQNWLELSALEQERTVRLLVKKRNLVRLQKLDKENKEEGEQLSALKDGQKEA